MAVAGLCGEVGAACVTGRDVLSSVRAADGIERVAEAGAVGGAQRSGRTEEKLANTTQSTGTYQLALRATAEGRGFGSPPSGRTQAPAHLDIQICYYCSVQGAGPAGCTLHTLHSSPCFFSQGQETRENFLFNECFE